MSRKKGRGSASATQRFVEALETRLLLAPMLVKDINTTPVDTSNLQPLLEYNNILYFTAATPETGVELWRSDGTAAGTLLVKDIQPGIGGSSPRSMVLFHGMLYFSARTDAKGRELWRTDGTPEGTQMVKDLFPGDNNGNPDGVDALAVVNDRLLFHAYVLATGREWYSTDGTDAGTQLIKDLAPGPTSGVVGGFAGVPTASYVFNGRLVYAGDNGTSGPKLWMTDGTADGTTLAASVSPSTGSGSMVVFNNDLYFVSSGQLWRLSASGTAAHFTDGGLGGMGVSSLTVAAGKLFFSASGTTGSFLWQTDRTPGSTMPTPGVGPAPSQLSSSGDRLFFVVTDASAGRELASTTGTADSYQIYDIRPGPANSNPSAMIGNAGTVYFTADDGTATGRELWKSDGLGATLVRDINPAGSAFSTSVNPLFVGGSRIWFRANDGVHGQELWVSDGTTAGTALVHDLTPTTASAFPSTQGVWRGSAGSFAYFVTTDGSNQLWGSDGTAEGTIHLTGPQSAPLLSVNYFVAAGDLIFFLGTDATHGQEVWVSDGSQAGTHMLADLNPGSISSTVALLGALGNRLFFAAVTSSTTSLWATDGTAPTRVTGLAGSTGLIGAFNGAAYYRDGGRLYRTDGTLAGTKLIKEFNSTAGVGGFVQAGGFLLFYASDGINKGIWRTDGTPQGTVFVHALGGTYSDYDYQTTVNNLAIFVASGNGTTDEIWRSDGTTGGTYALTSLSTPTTSSSIGQIAELKGAGYFLTRFPATYSLWKTDGSVNGTVEVKRFSTVGFDLVATGKRLYFAADGQLWQSDGTANGTISVGRVGAPNDTRAGLEGAVAGDTLFYDGWGPTTGNELYQIAAPVARAGSGYTVAAGDEMQLDGRSSSHPDPSENLQYLWDVDGDGIFGETGAAASRGDETGPTPNFSSLDLLPGTFTVTLRVVDSIGLDSTASAQITITPPAFMNLSADAQIGWSGTPGARILSIHGGTLTLTGDLSSVYAGISLVADGDATVSLPAVQHLKDLTLLDSATLDLGATSLLISAPQPMVTLASIRGLIKSGNLISSAVQGDPNLGIGYAFDAASSSVKVMATLLGDLNLDRTVSISDFIDLSSHFSQADANWSDGDVNYDNQVSIADFITLASNFGQSYSPGPTPAQRASATAVVRLDERVREQSTRRDAHHRRLRRPIWSDRVRRWIR